MTDVALLVSPEEDTPSFGIPAEVLSPGFLAQDLDALAPILALWGDDHFVASVARMLASIESDVLLAPLDSGVDSNLASELHGTLDPEAVVGSLLSGNFAQSTIESLRVTDSTLPGSMVAFSFGVGQIERAFEARELAERDGAGLEAIVRGLRGVESPLRTGARITINWRPVDEDCGWLHASTLRRSWLGTRISEDGRPRVRYGESAMEWLSHATRLGKWVSGKGDASSFDAIHIDADTGYVVDGRRFERSPRVVEVARGPSIRIAKVT